MSVKYIQTLLYCLLCMQYTMSEEHLGSDSIDESLKNYAKKISHLTINEGPSEQLYLMIDSALTLGYKHEKYEEIAIIVGNYAVNLEREGKLAKAKASLNRLLKHKDKIKAYYVGILLSKRAPIFNQENKIDSALADIKGALEGIGTGNNPVLLGDTKYFYATALYGKGDVYNATIQYKEASDLFYSVDDTYSGNICLEEMASVLYKSDLAEEALDVYDLIFERSEGILEFLSLAQVLDIYDKTPYKEREKKALSKMIELYKVHYDSLNVYDKYTVDAKLLWHYLNKDNIKKAEPYYKKVVESAFLNGGERDNCNITSNQLYYHILHENKKEATKFMDRLEHWGELGCYRTYYELKSKYYQLMGDIELENKALIEFIEFKDDENRKAQLNKMAYIHAQHESERKEFAIKQKETEIKVLTQENRNKNIIILSSIVGALFLLLLLLLRLRLQKLVSLNVLKENTIVKLEQEQLIDRLKSKDKSLADFALNLTNKNKAIEDLKIQVEEGISLDFHKDELLSLFSQDNIQEKDWNDFRERFVKIHASFFVNLKTRFPNLSPADEKLCALIKINMSSKEIANILLISPKSVDQKKYRLKKKIAENSDKDLYQIIA